MKAICGNLLACYGYLIFNTATSDSSLRICDINVFDLLVNILSNFLLYEGESNGKIEA